MCYIKMSNTYCAFVNGITILRHGKHAIQVLNFLNIKTSQQTENAFILQVQLELIRMFYKRTVMIRKQNK